MSCTAVSFHHAHSGAARTDPVACALAAGSESGREPDSAVSESGNIKITRVLDNLLGVSGRKMLASLTRVISRAQSDRTPVPRGDAPVSARNAGDAVSSRAAMTSLDRPSSARRIPLV